jgi:hypothetical protein
MGVLDEMLSVLAREADLEWLMIDSTIVRAHQHASGARKQKDPMMSSRQRPEGDQSRFATHHSEGTCHDSRTNLAPCRHPC